MKNVPIAKLRESFLKNLEDIDNAKKRNAVITESLLKAYGDARTAELKLAGKESGSKSFEEEGVKLKFEISKKVKWHSGLLESIGRSLPAEIAQKLFKVEISVPEKTFDALLDAELIRVLKTARTVEYGAPKVTFDVD